VNRTPNHSARVYCTDLAKNVIQVHGFSAQGECVERHRLSRARFDAFFSGARQAGALIVMEACASSHYWSRRLQARGYRVKLVPPQFVAKQRLGNKNDGNDCDAMYAVHRDARVRPVPVKSLAQQDLCAQHRVRELLVGQRTQCINQARGLLAERGCVAARGERGFADLLERVARHSSAELTPALAQLIGLLATQLRALNARIAELDAQLDAVLAESPLAQRLDGIFSVGAVTATAFVGEFGDDVSRFESAGQFAAGLGITPSEHSSGETRRLGAITRRGNPYLRRLLVQCAQTVVRHAARHEDAICLFARRLLARNKRRNVVVVAVANRLARIIFAVTRDQAPYQRNGYARCA
jgi:transposase